MQSLSSLVREEGGTYESPERLMRKEDVTQSEKLPFLEPNPKPPTSTVGRSRTDEAIPKPSQSANGRAPNLDMTGVLTNFMLSRYSFLPPNLGCYHNVGNQERISVTKGKSNFPGTAFDYQISPEEVKKRSAWSWYRTSLLYLQTARDVAARGPRQISLGISTLGTASTTELQGIIQRLRSKAENSKAHALELYPRLLEEESVRNPSWGKSFSDGKFQYSYPSNKKDFALLKSNETVHYARGNESPEYRGCTAGDRKYYREMADNYERVTRVDLSKRFKGFAMVCLCEAISVYLGWKEDNPDKSAMFAATPPSDFRLPYFGGAGGIARLWAEATKWSLHKDTDVFHALSFRQWWVRAAMARGHAEWLMAEFKYQKSASKPKGNSKRPIEPWRLLPPPNVGCYINDCVIKACLAVRDSPGPRKTWPFYQDDSYFTEYTIAQIMSRDWSYALHGDRNFNFGYGAPDFLYLDKAKSGWASDYLGVFPFDSTLMGINTGYYERYCRQGLSDFLPKSSSKYEQALAICVDDTILEWEQQRYQDIFTLPDDAGANVLADLEHDVFSLVHARQYLTDAEAQKHAFFNRLDGTIKFHFKRLHEIFNLPEIREIEESAKLMILARVERTLMYMTAPWYQFIILQPLNDAPPLGPLGDRSTGTLSLDGESLETIRQFMISKKVHFHVRYFHLQRIYQTLERLRGVLVKGGRLDKEEWLFVSCFRAYLETGDAKRLPLIKMGLKPERETTVTKFRKESIFSCDGTCGCEFDESEKTEIQRAKFRKSSQREAVNERLAIKRAFAEHEKSTAVSGNSRAQSNTADGQVHSQLLQELFANSSHSPSTMDAIREGLSENARTTLSGGQSQRMSTAGPHRVVVRREKKLTRADNPPSELSNGQDPVVVGKVNRKKTTGWLRRIFRKS